MEDDINRVEVGTLNKIGSIKNMKLVSDSIHNEINIELDNDMKQLQVMNEV